ncbi:hypothetical protein V1477_018624 [Vespula maculifrons]|uniref:Uncharacterized protein n=1 Tax=Vespula maculifrons TaxID=7453 RepID=A0ABD2AVY9_VESMC
MSDIIISEECVLRELRCVLFEIQGKTESVTVGSSEECVLRELRCVLFEIQGKTESVTVGPFILPPRFRGMRTTRTAMCTLRNSRQD